jgi:hypothetical protein
VLEEGVLQDREPNHISFLLENVSANSPDRALNEFIPATKSELDVAIRKSANTSRTALRIARMGTFEIRVVVQFLRNLL